MNQPIPHPALLKKPLPQPFVDALSARFDNRFSTSEAVRAHHGRDESAFDPMLPDAVVFAHSTEEVAEIVSLCSRYEVPVIAFGTGSSLEGHLLAIRGGLSVDVSEMKGVVAPVNFTSPVGLKPG